MEDRTNREGKNSDGLLIDVVAEVDFIARLFNSFHQNERVN